jgi:hypothetical protein
VTRPLRAVGRRARALTSALKPSRPQQNAPGAEGPPVPFTEGRYDSWLAHFHGSRLRELDAACENAGPEAYALFRSVDADLWALLLTQDYALYPNIRALLPAVSEAALQEARNGSGGAVLANQSKAFYSKLTARYSRYGKRALADARVLDFGCGLGSYHALSRT